MYDFIMKEFTVSEMGVLL